MKVYLNCYKDHWISPYKIVDYMFFWTKWSKCSRNKWYVPNEEWVDTPAWAEKLGDKLEWLSYTIQWVLNKVDRKIDYVKVDRWDTWSADATLARVILPVLKQLREQKTGYPFIKDEDVPEELRSDKAPPHKEHQWDDNAEKRFDWVLDEMIFAFECIVDDSWEEEYHSGKIDFYFVQSEKHTDLREMVHGPNHTYKWDQEGHMKVEKRIDNGTYLFGKYFRTLWT